MIAMHPFHTHTHPLWCPIDSRRRSSPSIAVVSEVRGAFVGLVLVGGVGGTNLKDTLALPVPSAS